MEEDVSIMSIDLVLEITVFGCSSLDSIRTIHPINVEYGGYNTYSYFSPALTELPA